MSDVETLRGQFSDDRFLRIRQEIHEQYTVPRIDFPAWVLDRSDIQSSRRLLNVGPANTAYQALIQSRYPDLQYLSVELSHTSPSSSETGRPVIIGDAQRLAYADKTFDVLLANHGVFHQYDIDTCIREFQRVLTDDGILVVSTNSVQTMPEFQALFRRALLLLSNYVRPNSPYLMPPHNAFTLESGVRRLARHFFAVVRHDLPSALVFPSIEPVMTYLDSLRAIRESQLPPDVKWDSLMDAMHDQVQRVLSLQGELIVSKLSGVLIAADDGGFIKTYRETLIQSRAKGKTKPLSQR